MARMIPPVPVPTNSPGEPDIFVRIRDDPLTSDWIALHSLGIATHKTQISGESDFVIIIPNKGVLFAEVKACNRVKREAGIWYLGNSPGETRGPFKQASESMHSLRERLVKARPHLSRIPFCSIVIFTHLRFHESSVEWHPWQVIDNHAMRGAPLGRLLVNVINKARDHITNSESGGWLHPGSLEPYREQCEEVASFFRPDFEYFRDYKSIANVIENELKTFTDEQFSALDSMESNPRSVFSGPAGTGKTVLAVEAAKRASSGGSKTILLCFNKLLGQRLAAECKKFTSHLNAKTLHSHMLEVAGLKHTTHESDKSFWEEELPELAIDALLSSSDDQYLFDQIIIDEAQDILRPNYLQFLDLSLRGGLSAGHWKFFGDFEKQSIYGSSNLELETFYGQLSARPTEYSLRINCRNTPGVAALAQFLGGLQPGYKRVLRPHDGIEPEYLFYDAPEEQIACIEGALEKFSVLGIPSRDIVILSTRGDETAAAGQIQSERWKNRIRRFDGAEGGYVRFCSIHAFKGLESAAIIVTDLNKIDRPSFESLLYIAVTRSLHRLVLVMNQSVKANLAGDIN